VLGIDLLLVLYTDSKSLYECLVKLGTTQEKRLMIDIMCLRQAYKRREIAEVKWIKGESNLADAMTKSKSSNALKRLIDTNTLQLDVEEWVERD
jgi:hydroxymethylglutaryl-CoA reductase